MTTPRMPFSPLRLFSAAWLALLAAPLARAACTPSGIILADPAGFAVKRCWTATDLNLPLPLGGLRFSDDGSMLYVVGAADSTSSAIYTLPVTRDGTQEVTDLAPSTGSFPGSSPLPDSGLDAGLELGPSGTFFDTYLGADASVLGERPGGIAGTETQFDMSTTLPRSVAGLAFSPFRVDPATQFGRLQVSIGLGAIYEVALTPASAGVFTPGAATLLVVVQPGGVGAIQYVPAGSSISGLVYTSLDDANIHRLEIDPATGLPVDRNTMTPVLGTANPKDDVFASGFAPGPLGLEFDASTGNDLFVSTYDPVLENHIYQIGGFSSGVPTTTSTTTTSTTTLPPGCALAASFASIGCRLGVLGAAVDASDSLGRLRGGLRGSVERAQAQLREAEQRSLGGRRRGARKLLGKAVRGLARFRSRLATRAARQRVPSDVRRPLTDMANAIVDDLRSLLRTI